MFFIVDLVAPVSTVCFNQVQCTVYLCFEGALRACFFPFLDHENYVSENYFVAFFMILLPIPYHVLN